MLNSTKKVLVLKYLFFILFTISFFIPFLHGKYEDTTSIFYGKISLFTNFKSIIVNNHAMWTHETPSLIVLYFIVEIILLFSIIFHNKKQILYIDFGLCLLSFMFFIHFIVSTIFIIKSYTATNKLFGTLAYRISLGPSFYLYLILALISLTYFLFLIIRHKKNQKVKDS